MSVLRHLVYLRSLRATESLPRNICAERPHDGATHHSEIQRGAERLPPSADSDATVYWLMLVVGVIPVTNALGRGGSTWGVAPTVGALFCVFAFRALMVAYIVRLREHSKRGRPHPHRI